ncbi:hypothetical protein JDV02_010013 [Purpureocillium takamizusanense]|uniref:Uncharacterized protein n=1 Tax=Purpureocillium takamizusanense TaxID=2060973 RepID=A0A9Q8QR01_9HYPO|nr:uncharacterized protein JDV02_010013 [Purpureocillium takamizusanense]UNI24250.1 hypothetical protein JDV02_010013 [Purpureocillium takamizusanense]
MGLIGHFVKHELTKHTSGSHETYKGLGHAEKSIVDSAMSHYGHGDHHSAVNVVFKGLAALGKATPYGRVASMLMSSVKDAKAFGGTLLSLVHGHKKSSSSPSSSSYSSY